MFFSWPLFWYAWMKRPYRQKKNLIWGNWCSAHGPRGALFIYRSSSSFVSWKYPKWKMHLIHLTYWTSELSLAHLKCAQSTYISLQLGKIVSHKAYFCNEVLNISCSWLSTVLKMKNRMVVWVQNVCKGVSCSPSWSCGWLGTATATDQLHKRGSRHSPQPGKSLKLCLSFTVPVWLEKQWYTRGKGRDILKDCV